MKFAIVIVIFAMTWGWLELLSSGSEPAKAPVGAEIEKIIPAKKGTVEIAHFRWYREAFDLILTGDFTIANTTQTAIKDMVIKCSGSAPSGTTIDSNTRTIYEYIAPGSTSTFKAFNMGFLDSRVTRVGCSVDSWDSMDNAEFSELERQKAQAEQERKTDAEAKAALEEQREAQKRSDQEPGRVFRVGGGVTAPSLLFKVEPEYSEAARQAKYQGTVLLYVQVDPSGKAVNMRVLHSLGGGLDEKAMESVGKWKFKPGMKDGYPVAVEAEIEVNFRLL